MTTEVGREARIRREAVIWLLALAGFFLAVYVFRSILLPFVAGMAIAYLLDPVCDRLEAWGLSRIWATVVVTLVFIGLMVLALVLLVPVLIGQVNDLIERLPKLIDTLRGYVVSLLERAEARFAPDTLERVRGALVDTAKQIGGWLTGMLGRLLSGGVAIANLVSLLVITPVVAFYLLRDWDKMVDRIDRWLPRRQAPTIREQMAEVDRTLAGWVRGQSMVCLILGGFYAGGLTLAGLDFGLVIGLFAGLLSFIPFVGAGLGGIASVGLALLQFDDWMRIAIVAGIFVAGQAIEGNVLTPKLVGDRVGLHPVWVIFALLAGGVLLGFVGVLLAVPVAAALGVLIRFMLSRYLDSSLYHGEEAAALERPEPGE